MDEITESPPWAWKIIEKLASTHSEINSAFEGEIEKIKEIYYMDCQILKH